ncbi:TlpA family protein disulfide reductase [Chitinophaga sp. 22321]|uniref:Thioredoxin fold domain-containing protein n=1 Tax=Chitinophaga hostae TaxID=2831022 RepID=A0ABS5IX56_9BACT|nr:thioredoxin fold domain-containing protein [Chitinophaga hostae]MBS0027559.1 thioredoxin fold domain-containing protein [Chitinophaga hostae]
MKRRERLLVIGIIVSGLVLFAGLCKLIGVPPFTKSRIAVSTNSIKTGHEGEPIPSIDILLSDSISYLNVRDIKSSEPVVLFYFGPDCPYCRAEMDEIIKGMNRLKNVQFLLITPYAYSDMKRFYKIFQLEKYSNIRVGIDYKYAFGSYFKTESIPYIVVYNRQKLLITAFPGIVKSDDIFKYGYM